MSRAIWAVLLVGVVATARANPPPESTKLFEEGRALAKEGKYAEACAKFEKSLELDRAPGTLLNYADCHEHLGHLALAWRLFDEVARVSEAENNVDRAKFARDRARAVMERAGTVVLRLAAPRPSGLAVSIAGREVEPAAELREVVDPGDVTVEVTAPGRESFTTTGRAEPGRELVIEVPPLEPVARGALPPQAETVRRPSRVAAAYTLGALGGASLVAGVVTGLVAKNKYEAELENGNCTGRDPPVCNAEGYRNANSAVTLGNISTVLGVGGLVVIGAGAVVFLTAPRDVVVIPTASAEAGGLAVVGRF